MAATGMQNPNLDPNNFFRQQSGGVGGGGEATIGVGGGGGEGSAAQGSSPMFALQASAAEMQYQLRMLEQALRSVLCTHILCCVLTYCGVHLLTCLLTV